MLDLYIAYLAVWQTVCTHQNALQVTRCGSISTGGLWENWQHSSACRLQSEAFSLCRPSPTSWQSSTEQLICQLCSVKHGPSRPVFLWQPPHPVWWGYHMSWTSLRHSQRRLPEHTQSTGKWDEATRPQCRRLWCLALLSVRVTCALEVSGVPGIFH